MCDREPVPRITATTTIAAPQAEVFAYAADYRHATAIVPGLRRFEPTSDTTTGLGAEFAATIELGPAKYDATLAVTVYEPDRTIGWATTSSPAQSLLWTFADDGGRTAVEFELGVELPGGISGSLLSMTLEPILRARARESADALKQQVEASR